MKIFSIFTSINGEVCSAHQGRYCTFIRFAGCSVGCDYCDTKYAADATKGMGMYLEDITSMCLTPYVTITGGEPFEQMDSVITLVNALHALGKEVSIETSGAVHFNRNNFDHPQRVTFVVDMKKHKLGTTELYKQLHKSDFIKMVVGSEDDMIFNVSHKAWLQDRHKVKANFAFSPMEGKITPSELLALMVKYRQHDAILNVQLHKILGLTEDKDSSS